MSGKGYLSDKLVSSGDIKVEVGKAVQRRINGDLNIDLEGSSHSLYFHDLQEVRSWRDRVVHGSYDRISGHSEMMLVKKSYKEVVVGGVTQHASVEGESIIGGAYNANHIGLFLRMTAFADFMAWGGWAEADAVRVEMCMLGIRSYMGYAHKTMVKQVVAINLFDDWVNRIEKFGAFNQRHTKVTVLPSGPGALTQQDN